MKFNLFSLPNSPMRLVLLLLCRWGHWVTDHILAQGHMAGRGTANLWGLLRAFLLWRLLGTHHSPPMPSSWGPRENNPWPQDQESHNHKPKTWAPPTWCLWHPTDYGTRSYIPILQLRELRLWALNLLSQHHGASKWQSWSLNQGSLPAKATFLTPQPHCCLRSHTAQSPIRFWELLYSPCHMAGQPPFAYLQRLRALYLQPCKREAWEEGF